MSLSPGPKRPAREGNASADRRDCGGSSRTNQAEWLAIARQRRAERLKTLLTAEVDWRACSRVLLLAAAVALVGFALAPG